MTAPLSRLFYGEEEDRLLDQYHVTLNVNFNRLLCKGLLPNESIDRIAELLAADHDWRSAYEVELELASLFDEDTLDVELNRSLAESRTAGRLKES